MLDIKDLIQKKIHDDDGWGKDDTSLGRFHPSSLGYCKRQLFLSKIGAKDMSKWKGHMQAGTNLHHWIQSFKEIREQCDIELPVVAEVGDGIYIKGNADIVHKETKYVWDIKSIKSVAYIMRDPKPEHVEQINAYMVGVGSDEGEILYVQKDNLDIVVQKVKVNHGLFQLTRKKIMDVYPSVVLWHNKEIKYCPFSKCGCYFCKTENLKPEFRDIDNGDANVR